VPLALPTLHRLTVRPPQDVTLRALGVTGHGVTHWLQPDPSGEFTCENLRAGTYWIGNPQNGWMEVSLPAPGGFDFVPLPNNAIVINSYDFGGVLYGAGLRKGDAIRVINGRRFEDGANLAQAWAAAKATDSNTLELIRAGTTVHVTIRGADLAKAEADGGRVSFGRR